MRTGAAAPFLLLLTLSLSCDNARASTWDAAADTNNATAWRPSRNDDILVVPITTCGVSLKVTPQQLQTSVFGENDASSVRGAMASCTANSIRLGGRVVPTVLSVPCVDANNCDYRAWSDVADKYLDANGYGAFRHRVYVVPGFCNFAGMGEIGCKAPGQRPAAICRAWINAEYARGAAPYLHEIGHNLGLQHAGTASSEYGDATDAMGYCCNVRCYNGIHAHQLGTSKPKLDLACDLSGTSHEVTLSHRQYVVIRCPDTWVYLQYLSKAASSKEDMGDTFAGVGDDARGVVVAYRTIPWRSEGRKFEPTTVLAKWPASGVVHVSDRQRSWDVSSVRGGEAGEVTLTVGKT